jgi:hypothetical protein
MPSFRLFDEARLADAREALVEDRRAPEDLALRGHALGRELTVQLRLGRHVVPRLAHHDDREERPECDEPDAEVERLWPEAVLRGHEAGRERAARDGEVARELVEAHREATLLGTCEVDLLHRRRLRRDVGERVDELVAGLREQRVPARAARQLAREPRARGLRGLHRRRWRTASRLPKRSLAR